MDDDRRPPNPTGLLVRLEEYSRRMYEEENDRTSRLNGASRNLFLILAATVAFLGAVAEWLLPRPADELPTSGGWLLVVLLMIASLLALASFVCILFALRVRTFERLCDPFNLATRSLFFQSEDEVLAVMISDQLIASGRNHRVNETKAGMLSRAYLFYFTSTAVVMLATLIALAAQRGVP